MADSTRAVELALCWSALAGFALLALLFPDHVRVSGCWVGMISAAGGALWAGCDWGPFDLPDPIGRTPHRPR